MSDCFDEKSLAVRDEVQPLTPPLSPGSLGPRSTTSSPMTWSDQMLSLSPSLSSEEEEDKESKQIPVIHSFYHRYHREDEDERPRVFLSPEDEVEIQPEQQRLVSAQLEFDRVKRNGNSALRNLIGRSGMPMTQENGQRRYGPPPDYQGPPPSKGCEVFVGKIPREALEAELVPLFEKIGRIYELRIMMDFSGVNRGYGFVQYFTPEDASRAIIHLNNYQIRPGKWIGVVKSVDNCRLYLGGIPKEKSQDEIFQEISGITEGVTRIIVHQLPEDRSKNRGFAFIEYENHKLAAMARRKMLPGKILMWGCDVVVDWAKPRTPNQNAAVEPPKSNFQGSDYPGGYPAQIPAMMPGVVQPQNEFQLPWYHSQEEFYAEPQQLFPPMEEFYPQAQPQQLIPGMGFPGIPLPGFPQEQQQVFNNNQFQPIQFYNF